MREERRKAERLLGIFVASLYSTNQDAGWHQPSVLQMLIDYAGDLPGGTGFDQADLKMISEIRWIISTHPELPLAKQLMSQIELKQQMVMVVWARLKGLVCAETNSVWTERQMASAIKLDPKEFTKLKEAGMGKLISLL